MDETNQPPRLGVWLIGARGAISTCVAHGLAGLVLDTIPPIGLVTERHPFADLGLRPLDALVLGGWDVREGDVVDELVTHGILTPALVAQAAADYAAFTARLRPGLLDDPVLAAQEEEGFDPAAVALTRRPALEQVRQLREDLGSFRRDHGLDRVVVVNLASTEPLSEEEPWWRTLGDFEAALGGTAEVPPSCIYAYAALSAGSPFVNFTPNLGSSIPALRDLAREKGLPHCGNDGKTGETLLKAALAPMFAARALKVHAWQGYNMLGNRDGATLSDPVRRAAKCRNKDGVVRSVLGDDDVHTKVAIDFVPSLHDWKTAWDFIHFEGFLGAKMSMQITWAGSDSALAAPLVLDLARLADFAAERGEGGEMEHTACFFKSPLVEGTHDFHAQFRVLERYAKERR